MPVTRRSARLSNLAEPPQAAPIQKKPVETKKTAKKRGPAVVAPEDVVESKKQKETTTTRQKRAIGRKTTVVADEMDTSPTPVAAPVEEQGAVVATEDAVESKKQKETATTKQKRAIGRKAAIVADEMDTSPTPVTAPVEEQGATVAPDDVVESKKQKETTTTRKKRVIGRKTTVVAEEMDTSPTPVAATVEEQETKKPERTASGRPKRQSTLKPKFVEEGIEMEVSSDSSSLNSESESDDDVTFGYENDSGNGTKGSQELEQADKSRPVSRQSVTKKKGRRYEESSESSDSSDISDDDDDDEDDSDDEEVVPKRGARGAMVRRRPSNPKAKDKGDPHWPKCTAASIAKKSSAPTKSSVKNSTALRTVHKPKPDQPWKKNLTQYNIERKEAKGERRMKEFRQIARAISRGRVEEISYEECYSIFQELKKAYNEGRRLLDVVEQPGTETSVKKEEAIKNDDGSSSEDEWEEMEAIEPTIDKKNIEVTLKPEHDGSPAEKDWWVVYLRQEVNKCVRNLWENTHKTHLLCYMVHLNYLVKVSLDERLVPSLMVSQLPSGYLKYVGEPLPLDVAKKLIGWYSDSFKPMRGVLSIAELNDDLPEGQEARWPATTRLTSLIAAKCCETDSDRAVLLFCLLVGMEQTARICVNVNAISRKWDKEMIGEMKKKLSEFNEVVRSRSATPNEEKKEEEPEDGKSKKKSKSKLFPTVLCMNIILKVHKKSIAYLIYYPLHEAGHVIIRILTFIDYKVFTFQMHVLTEKRIRNRLYRQNMHLECENFVIDERQYSNDHMTSFMEGVIDEAPKTIKEVRNYWVEYWCTKYKRWVVMDPLKKTVDEPLTLEQNASQPLTYVFAIDNKRGIVEVTQRYALDYVKADFRRRRTDQSWLARTVRLPVFAANEQRRELERLQMNEELIKRPLPVSLAEFKNHPLYVLEKDLLKFEAIYPPVSTLKPLGEVRGHKVYPRSCVYTLQGELNWVKLARSVKIGEKAYKQVKARPNLRIPVEERVDRFTDVFGFWQTEPFRREVIKNGKIPRNEFGNVYMFQPVMCPIGAVHLKLPGLIQISRKLKKECVQAVVGWDFSGGATHPVMDGAIVLEEDADEFIAEWNRLEEGKAAKEEKKRLDRIHGNWKKLIKGMLRLKKVRNQFLTAAPQPKPTSSDKPEPKRKQTKKTTPTPEPSTSTLIDNTTATRPLEGFTLDDLMKSSGHDGASGTAPDEYQYDRSTVPSTNAINE